ncbi:tyrosine-type recombinase/integrase [Shewanella cutis]|uniref:Tyrosine-type recombinase/integrase n=1 Tax=Shewanella cutis TaxID=2766780 RepID=A0ABS9QW34_9GAMM|nr:tyrosine-type recombinase/integrase [Shewanella sp. PS-2]MCG9964570.1 tyrosine-type recombinase/integrase [Shewanella sp. PS-2]
MSTLPKGVEKLPVGVEINYNTVRIVFMLNGERCREPLTGYSKITKSVIKYAENKRNAILTEIAENRFDYLAHFPDSAKAAALAGMIKTKLTVVDAVNQWLSVQEATKAKSTFKNYKTKAQHVINKWGSRKLADISKSEFELFQAELLRGGLSPKTVNDIFTIVRGVWSEAFHEGAIKANPLDRVKNVERDNLEETADPFTREELARIENINTVRQGDINMIMFWCWAGLSLSEIIALAWEDIDTETWTIKVQRAKVLNQYKVPKERGRIRVIELLEPAKVWLQRQMELTYMQQTAEYTVQQRDNITSRQEAIRLVFLNGKSNEPWYDNSVRRWFASILKRAKLRHRGPNQCRHTFASQLLSNYVPLEWVARQLGHSDTTMIKKHYGKWIPKDSQRMASRISEMMGFNADINGQENADFAQILPRSNIGNQ